ncbi:MAG TPA: hypothetical protein VIV66_12315, partial [Pyrinomonadaceae bacterium]
IEPLVFRLDMINDAIMLDVSIKAGDHDVSVPALVSRCGNNVNFVMRSVEGNTPIFAGSITFFPSELRWLTVLDTPDQFD